MTARNPTKADAIYLNDTSRCRANTLNFGFAHIDLRLSLLCPLSLARTALIVLRWVRMALLYSNSSQGMWQVSSRAPTSRNARHRALER